MLPLKNNNRRKGLPDGRVGPALRERHGQNVTEYLILVAGVLVVVIGAEACGAGGVTVEAMLI